ncbi:MAG: CHAT domain-containing protein, partial [Nitrososphaera sp.]|nr:CHAT domain-containing protein [Nitrososphaera sp.]
RLIDYYHVSYLSTGRDVLRFNAASSGQPAEPLVIADPDFDLGAVTTQPQSKISEPPGRRSSNPDLSEIVFDPLPGARTEGEYIANKLKAEPWLGTKALEKRIKACCSPRIMHLATHGFFLKDQEFDPNKDARGLGAILENNTKLLSVSRLENPLIRSGLALAGANWKSKGFIPPAEAEDGLLTAEDVIGLDLLATELVVLSACETGLGEVRTGEGVFGLRRAFVLAGAKTLVMSLWKVPDLATAILMERFYDNLLNRRDSHGQPFGRSEALRDAQFYTRDITTGQIRDRWLNAEMIERLSAGNSGTRRELQELAQKPDDHCPFTLPIYWGAFICQGNPSPLAATTAVEKASWQGQEEVVITTTGKPRVFGFGCQSPLTVFWTEDDAMPVRFNEGSFFAVSVNSALSNAYSIIVDIHNALPKYLAGAVVFELFTGPFSSNAIEIGSRIPKDLSAAILKSCTKYSVPLSDVYRVDEDGRFGYCQRAYVGSLKPSGVRLDSDAM